MTDGQALPDSIAGYAAKGCLSPRTFMFTLTAAEFGASSKKAHASRKG